MSDDCTEMRANVEGDPPPEQNGLIPIFNRGFEAKFNSRHRDTSIHVSINAHSCSYELASFECHPDIVSEVDASFVFDVSAR